MKLCAAQRCSLATATDFASLSSFVASQDPMSIPPLYSMHHGPPGSSCFTRHGYSHHKEKWETDGIRMRSVHSVEFSFLRPSLQRPWLPIFICIGLVIFFEVICYMSDHSLLKEFKNVLHTYAFRD